MPNSYEELIQGLQSPLEAERVKAIEGLVRLNDLRVIRALQRVVSRDASVRVRYVAKKALYVFKERNKDALPAEQVEAKAAGVPPQIDLAKIRKILDGDDVTKKLKLLQAAAKFRLKEAVPALLKHGSDEVDPVVRSNLVTALGILGGAKEIKPITGFLQDADFRVRANAIEALEHIDQPDCYPPLVNLLSDGDNRIRANAIKALKNYGKVNVANLLRKMLQSDQVWMRDSAAYALSVMAKDDALPLLIEAARDADQSIRDKARKGIKKLADRGNRVAGRVLVELDREGEPGSGGVVSFSELEEEMLSEEKKEDPLDNPDPQLRLQAVRNIVAEKDSARIFDLVNAASGEEDDFVKANIIIALGELGDENLVEPLKDYLKDSVDRVRANTVETLGRIGGEKAYGLLAPMLADKNNRTRANAIIALKDCGYVDVYKSLSSMVDSDQLLMRKSAFYAITDLASDEVVPYLEKLYVDEDPDLRSNALHFLKMMRDGGSEPAGRLLERLEEGEGGFGERAVTTAELFPGADDGLIEPEDAVNLGEISLDLSDEGLAAAEAKDLAESAPAERKPSRADNYDIAQFSSLGKGEKRRIIEELSSDITVGSYYFLKQVQSDKDFEIKCLARMALKNFDDFATEEGDGTPTDGAGYLKPPEIVTVEYHGMSKAIQLSRELNDRADQYNFRKTWTGPFPENAPILNAMRKDTQEMLQEAIGDDTVEEVTVCFQHTRLKPFLEGRRSLDGNRFAHVVTLANVVNRIDAFSPSVTFLKSIKRPIYELCILTDRRVILFLRGPLETSFARYIAIHYEQIDKIDTQKFKDLVTALLHVGGQFFEIPELYGYVARPFVDHIRDKNVSATTGGKHKISGEIDRKKELKKLEALRKGKVLSQSEYLHRRHKLGADDE